ncbi:MAG: hypothetical protein KDK23_12780 [Leptospiraceae bacterium]|nr:hypothetical protein [Leptospiraceae bacterium]
MALCLTAVAPVAAEPLLPCPSVAGNSLYQAGQYSLSSLAFYESGLDTGTDCAERYALSRMRDADFGPALDALNNRHAPSSFLLRMFAAIPLQRYNSALFDRDQLLLSDATDRQKDVGRLLGISVYMDAGDYARANKGLEELQKQTAEEDLRLLIGRVRTDLLEYETLDRKSPWLAGSLAALFPGAGHVYTEHYTDAALSLFWNGVFLGGGAYLYNLENRAEANHTGSIVFGLAGLLFYAANITGAISSAHRYNFFQERDLQQKIRERYFNLDFIEKQSGLTFEVR